MYNASKEVAVGPRAADLVAMGAASAAGSYATVFGAPVGDVGTWAREVWAARWGRIVESLELAFRTDQEAAVRAAHLIRGPGASAAHWLRCAPATDPHILEVLRSADDAWARLWRFFGGGSRAGAADPALVARVFGGGPACLGHSSAVQAADSLYRRGVSEAWPFLATWSIAAGIPWRDFAAALTDVPSGQLGPAATVRTVGAHLAAAAAASEEALAVARAAAGAAVAAAPGPGAKCTPAAAAAGTPNFWVASLGAGGGPGGGRIAAAGGPGASLVVARILGLPVWPALGVPRFSHCRRCLAPSALRAEPGPPGRHTRGATATRALDDFGQHALVCPKGGIRAGGKRRHDECARGLAAVSAMSGSGGRYHDGPVFTWGPKTRPADFMDKEGSPQHPEGRCVDFTCGLRERGLPTERELAKVAKYRAQMAAHPHLSFAPFGADLCGELGPSAGGILASWARTMGAARALAGIPAGNTYGEVMVAACRVITRALTDQMVQWASPIA